jgi:hypothetical protein
MRCSQALRGTWAEPLVRGCDFSEHFSLLVLNLTLGSHMLSINLHLGKV